MFIDVSSLKKSYTAGMVKNEVLKGIGIGGNRCHPWAIRIRKIHPDEYHRGR